MEDEGVADSLQLAVIGAGRAGRHFALRCLAVGQHLTIEDVLPARLRSMQEEYSALNASAGSGVLKFVSSVEDAVRDADVVVDFVPDELESKLEIFSLVDRMAPPRTILLTPTDALSISDLASCTYRPERCFGMRGLGEGAAAEPALLTLSYPNGADTDARVCVEKLLRRLGFAVTAMQDEMPSLLAGR